MNSILVPVLILAILGFIFALGLGAVSQKFHVEKSVKEQPVSYTHLTLPTKA